MDWLLNLASKRISPTATVQVLYYWVFYYYYYFNRLMKIKPFHANACVALLYVNHYCHHHYFSRYYYYYHYYYHNYYHHYYFHLCYDTIFLKIHILPTYYFSKRKIFFNFDIVMQNKLYHVYLSIIVVIIIFVFIIFIFIFIIIIIIVTIFVLL